MCVYKIAEKLFDNCSFHPKWNFLEASSKEFNKKNSCWEKSKTYTHLTWIGDSWIKFISKTQIPWKISVVHLCHTSLKAFNEAKNQKHIQLHIVSLDFHHLGDPANRGKWGCPSLMEARQDEDKRRMVARTMGIYNICFGQKFSYLSLAALLLQFPVDSKNINRGGVDTAWAIVV